MRLRTKSWYALGALPLALSACRNDTISSGGGDPNVSGRLVMVDGSPASGARLTLVPAGFTPSPGGANARFETSAGEDGRYALSQIPAGNYNLLASKDGYKVFRGPLAIGEPGSDLGRDTLRATGTISGKVQLQPGDDARTVLILLLGTPMVVAPDDREGNFQLRDLAEGNYRARFLSTIREYQPLDTVLRIRTGMEDTLPQPLLPIFTGASDVVFLEAEWDSTFLVSRLQWSPHPGNPPSGYQVYRSRLGQPFGSPLHSIPVSDTVYIDSIFLDSTVSAGERFVYGVKSIDGNGNPSRRFSPLDTVAFGSEYRALPEVFPTDRSYGKIAFGGGHIFRLIAGGAVEARGLDGERVRVFGADNLGEREQRHCLRIIRDTLYAFDAGSSDPETGGGIYDIAKLKRFSVRGEFIDSQMVGRLPSFAPTPRDFWVSSGGTTFVLTWDNKVVAYSNGGFRESLLWPSGLLSLQGFAPMGELLLTLHEEFVRDSSGVLGRQKVVTFARQEDLTLAAAKPLLDSGPCLGLTTDGDNRIWLLYRNYLEIRNADLQVLQRVPVPHRIGFGHSLALDGNDAIAIATDKSLLILKKAP